MARSPGVRYSEPLGSRCPDPRGSEYLTPGLPYLIGSPPVEPVDLRELLEQVQQGNLGIEEALQRWRQPAVADLGFAHVDLQRRQRCGFPEVIFCPGKA